MQNAVCLFLGGSAKIPLLDIKWPIVKGQMVGKTELAEKAGLPVYSFSFG